MSLLKKIRVLIVDDSFFMRKLLREILILDRQIEVVGVASGGEEAIIKNRELKPDVITLDYNMPGRDGIAVIKDLLDLSLEHKPAVIMISAHTLSGSGVALDCLRAGAIDFIPKPSGELSMDIETIKDEIILKIHVAALAKVTTHPQVKKDLNGEKVDSLVSSEKVVVIGSSTGGPPLVEDIISLLPADLKATVIIAQHMPPYFISRFAERLSKLTPLDVTEAKDGDFMLVGKVYVVPADFDFEISESKRVKLSELGKYQGAKPSIDRVMEATVKIYKQNVIGVILTGMGEDGLLGAKRIKKAGGLMIAQDPMTAVIDSMPNAIIDAKLADEILLPVSIPGRLVSLTK